MHLQKCLTFGVHIKIVSVTFFEIRQLFLEWRKGNAILGHRSRGTYALTHLGRQNSRCLLFWEFRPRLKRRKGNAILGHRSRGLMRSLISQAKTAHRAVLRNACSSYQVVSH
jgi:hypothetical protein